MILEIFKMWTQITAEGYLTFPVSLQWFQVLLPCWAATKVGLLTHGIHQDYRKTFLVIKFLTFDSPGDYSRRIQSDDVQRNRGAAPEAERMKTSHTSEDRQSQGTIPMPTFATRPLTTSSSIPVEFRQNSMVGQQRQQISELQFGKFPNPQSFLVWKSRFKTQVTTCSDFPSDAVLWIKEVEMVDFLEELKSSRSVCGNDFPNFEMLDAKIASALNKIIQNSQFKKKVRIETRKPKRGPVSSRKTDRLHDLRLLSSDWRSRHSNWIMLI